MMDKFFKKVPQTSCLRYCSAKTTIPRPPTATAYNAVVKLCSTAALYDTFLLMINKRQKFVFRQKGGGFDGNLWNAKAVHDSTGYIEANPVRSRLVASPDEWKWSSAHARAHRKGVVPDTVALPVVLENPQAQRIGII
jgi:hypothetical protein